MTYIKPEKVANQSSSVSKILNRVQKAVEREDWLEVSTLLRELPQNKARKQNRRFILAAAEWQQVFDLALTMLM
ncbi:MAG: hypothetical protein AAFQ23_12860, partial [Cyanobacteria bacterium J06623_1]